MLLSAKQMQCVSLTNTDVNIRLGININMKYFTYSIFSSDMTKPRV